MGSICTLIAYSSSFKKAPSPRSSSCVVSGGGDVLSPAASPEHGRGGLAPITLLSTSSSPSSLLPLFPFSGVHRLPLQ